MNEKISCHKVDSFVPIKKSVTRNSLEEKQKRRKERKKEGKKKKRKKRERREEKEEKKERRKVSSVANHMQQGCMSMVDGMKERVVPVKSQGS